jgi:signal transduction histidine kinase
MGSTSRRHYGADPPSAEGFPAWIQPAISWVSLSGPVRDNTDMRQPGVNPALATARPSGYDKSPGRWAPVALGVAGGVMASIAIATTWRIAPYPLWVWVPVQVAGLSFTLSGVLVWLRRPANPTGRLMTAVGLTWYIGDLQLSSQPALFAVGFCFYYLSYGVMGHLVLALPDGRLRRSYERRIVSLLYAAPPVTQTVRYVAEYPPEPQGWGDPHATYSAWAAVGSVTELVLTVVTIGLVIRRWSAAGRPVRRAYTLVWATIVAMGCAVAADAVAGLFDVPIALQQYLLLAYALGLVVTPVVLAGGLLRVRMARVGVADLVLRLEQTSEPEHVRVAIADALGDPTLELFFPLPNAGDFVRSDGRSVHRLANGDRATTPVVRRGDLLAVLVHDPALLDQPPLVDAVLAASGLALDNARLLAGQRAQLEEIRASRARIVLATDAERQRIQRDLHDGIQHKLLAVSMLMERARDPRVRPEATERHAVPEGELAMAATQLREVIGELRVLTEGIHPPALTEQGLAAAVEVLAERAPVPILADVPARRWPEHLERAAYFVITETLANVYKHAGASRARVRVDGDAYRLVVEVADDGVGGVDLTRGTGLRGLYDRVGALNGRLQVESPPGSGTRVVAELPCES